MRDAKPHQDVINAVNLPAQAQRRKRRQFSGVNSAKESSVPKYVKKEHQPTFHHGGNIKDPLALQRTSPIISREGSPLHDSGTKDPNLIDVVIPNNLRDPLNLTKDIKHSKKRNKRKKSVTGAPHMKKKMMRLEEFSKATPSPDTLATLEQKPDARFVHGNYNQYYGKRLPDHLDDKRLEMLRPEWFNNKEVLDIGCNIGHVTLTLAATHNMKRITGIDIDTSLVRIARKNIKHYHSLKKASVADQIHQEGFPRLFVNQFGELNAQASMEPPHLFPNNVKFESLDYVLSTDSEVDLVRPEYDTILALSVSKWIHLNNGDPGLKRFFRRVFAQLRPGGHFIFEPQPWKSYSKRKKLTATIYTNYKSIQLKPELFSTYLCSEEIGFKHYHELHPNHRFEGFKRTIHVYYKPATSLSSQPPAASASTSTV